MHNLVDVAAGGALYCRRMTTSRMHLIYTPAQAEGVESIPTVIIGGGQAGLVMGYHLQQAGEEFVILDAQPRIGDAWRDRWDSLRLFSFAKYSSLPGWPIQVGRFPTHSHRDGGLPGGLRLPLQPAGVERR
jgi:hypothetical protein